MSLSLPVVLERFSRKVLSTILVLLTVQFNSHSFNHHQQQYHGHGIFVAGWRQWKWDGDWANISYSNRDFLLTDGPTSRRGHSLTLRHDDRVIIFGGMSNNEPNLHRPKTFEIEEIDGSLEFTSYDQKEVVDCTGKLTKECKAFPYIQRDEIKVVDLSSVDSSASVFYLRGVRQVHRDRNTMVPGNGGLPSDRPCLERTVQ